MSIRENDLIRELTASEMDIVTGGDKQLVDAAQAAARAAQKADGSLDSILQTFHIASFYNNRY
jgi:hypothetical protein